MIILIQTIKNFKFEKCDSEYNDNSCNHDDVIIYTKIHE